MSRLMADLEFLRRIRRLAILAMFSDDTLLERLVLKGGNLLDLVYGGSARASVDVDFSMENDFDDRHDGKRRVFTALEATFLENGFKLLDPEFKFEPQNISQDMEDFWGGYQIAFKIIEVDRYHAYKDNPDKLSRIAIKVGQGQSPKFRIDISPYEYCEDKIEFQLDDLKIFGYSPEMFIAEKLRALCQQMKEYARTVHKDETKPRSRDFLDIQIVSESKQIDWSSSGFHLVVRKVFEKKRVPLQLLSQIPATFDQHANDFQSVLVTVSPDYHLQEFNYYFSYVCEKVKELKVLWNI